MYEVRDSIEKIQTKNNWSENDMDSVLKSVFNYRSRGCEEKSEEETENGHYVYVPWDRNSFTYLVKEIQKKFKLKFFIDVGCGIGDKVILAYFFGNFEKVTGIELNETTYHVAKYFVTKGMFDFERYEEYYKVKKDFKGWEFPKERRVKIKREILNVNAFDHNFSEYDFIYMYVPIRDSKVMEKLYHKIFKEMPIGGIMIDVSGFPISALNKLPDIKIKNKKRNSYGYYAKKIGKMEFQLYKISWGR